MKSNKEIEPKKGARESDCLQTSAGTAPLQGTTRPCKNLGALPCKTAPLTYQNPQIKPLRKAIDSLYLTYQGTIYPKINDHLAHLKLIASNKTSDHSSEAIFQILDHRFEVRPSGARNFAYVLQDNWFFIKISSSNATTLPLASVQISSELLTHQPLEKIVRDLKLIISAIGYTHEEEGLC